MKPNEKRLAEWQLDRERFHLAPLYPPRKTGKACHIGEILSNVRPQPKQNQQHQELLHTHWPLVAGAQIAKHTQPVEISGKTLIVYVDHPGWLTQLKRTPKAPLLKKINRTPGLPEIADIRFLLDPEIRTYRN
jgi:hypothetical protein